jgi:hypothetical protein
MKFSFPIPSKGSLVGGFVMVFFITLYAGGLWYVHHLKAAVQQSASDLAEETAREASLRNLGSLVGEVEGDAQALSSFFIHPDHAVDVIEAVEALGRRLGTKVTISNVKIEDKNSDTGEGIMVINVAAEGSWRTMMDLAKLLDTFPSVSRIDNLTLSREDSTPEGGTSWQLRATVRLWLRR